MCMQTDPTQYRVGLQLHVVYGIMHMQQQTKLLSNKGFFGSKAHIHVHHVKPQCIKQGWQLCCSTIYTHHILSYRFLYYIKDHY